jgi:hypothetical protein
MHKLSPNNPTVVDEMIKQEISDAVESIEEYLINSDQNEDLLSRIRDGWTLDQCRDHVIYKILYLRWHLCTSSAQVNPERFFLSYIKEEAEALKDPEAFYTCLHPSLRFNG